MTSESAVETSQAPMRLEIVVARARNGVIGADNGMPWHLPADLRHFRELTLGASILMGRRTQAAIGRALPGRRNLVLSRQIDLQLPGMEVVPSLQAALALASQDASPVLFVVGGAEIYQLCLPLTAVLHITEVDASLAGDTHFPEFDPADWQETAARYHPADARHAHAMTFRRLERRQRAPLLPADPGAE